MNTIGILILNLNIAIAVTNTWIAWRNWKGYKTNLELFKRMEELFNRLKDPNDPWTRIEEEPAAKLNTVLDDDRGRNAR